MSFGGTGIIFNNQQENCFCEPIIIRCASDEDTNIPTLPRNWLMRTNFGTIKNIDASLVFDKKISYLFIFIHFYDLGYIYVYEVPYVTYFTRKIVIGGDYIGK